MLPLACCDQASVSLAQENAKAEPGAKVNAGAIAAIVGPGVWRL
jgi:hypothetical protein